MAMSLDAQLRTLIAKWRADWTVTSAGAADRESRVAGCAIEECADGLEEILNSAPIHQPLPSTIKRVTAATLDDCLKRYSAIRGGELNEETFSEAAFIMLAQYRGAYILNTGLGVLWIGLQNASGRWSDGGKPFATVRSALEVAMKSTHPTAVGSAVYYSEDSVERLRWVADRLEEFKQQGTFLMWA